MATVKSENGKRTRINKDGTKTTFYEKKFRYKGKQYSVSADKKKDLAEKVEQKKRKIDRAEEERKQEEERQRLEEEQKEQERRNPTLNQYYQRWKEFKQSDVNNGQMHENSLRNYDSVYRTHITQVLGDMKIKDIKKYDIKQMFDSFSDMSGNTYNHVLHVTKLIFNDAVRDEVIAKNPAFGIRGKKVSKTEAQKGKHKAMTLEEQAAFMGEMKEDFYFEYVALMLCTGMRNGEMAVLRWSDIDFKKKQIHVQRTRTQGMDNKEHIGDTKSASGNRIIPITETEIAILKSQRQKMRDLFGDTVNFGDSPVFMTINEKMPSAVVINDAISKAIKRANDKGANIQPFTSHALRDTYATRWIEQSNDYKTLQVILGHSSLAMTMDRYAQVLEDKKHEERAKVKIAF